MSDVNSMKQKIFLNHLGKYVNHGSLNKSDVLLGYFSPIAPFHKNASLLSSLHSKLNSESKGTIKEKFNIPQYQGTNPAVLKVSDFIREHVAEYVKAVIVHGSLASNEEIAYSDFDALVILKDSTLNSPTRLINAAINLSKCYSLMLEFDPLQHHGWFAMSETDLLNYPVSYLPPEVLPFCCSLNGPVELNISYSITPISDSSFFKLVNSLTKQIQPDYIPKNLFYAKSIMSEFMMLPTLFIQHKTLSGIYKKFSFEKAKQYFTTEEWKVMDEISELRRNWTKENAMLSFDVPCVMSVAKKKKQKSHAPLLSDQLKNKFESGLSTRMLDFIDTLKLKANET